MPTVTTSHAVSKHTLTVANLKLPGEDTRGDELVLPIYVAGRKGNENGTRKKVQAGGEDERERTYKIGGQR